MIREQKEMEVLDSGDARRVDLAPEMASTYDAISPERAIALVGIAKICGTACWGLLKDGANDTAQAVAQAALFGLAGDEKELVSANILAKMGQEISGSSDRAAIRDNPDLRASLEKWGAPFIKDAVSVWVKEGLSLAKGAPKNNMQFSLAGDLDSALSRHWVWGEAFAPEVKAAPEEAGWGWVLGEDLKSGKDKRIPSIWRWGDFGGELWAHLAWKDELRGAKALHRLTLRGNANQGEALAGAQKELNAQRARAVSADSYREQAESHEKWARLTVLLTAFSERAWRASGFDENALGEGQKKWGMERAAMKAFAFAPGEQSPLAIAVRSENSKGLLGEGFAALWPSPDFSLVSRRMETFLLTMGEIVASPVITNWLLEMSAAKYGPSWQAAAKATIPVFVGARVRDAEFMRKPGIAEAIFAMSDDLSFAQSAEGFSRLLKEAMVKELLRALQGLRSGAASIPGAVGDQDKNAEQNIEGALMQKRGVEIWRKIFSAPAAPLPSYLPIEDGAHAQEHYDNEAHALLGFAQAQSNVDAPFLHDFFVEGVAWLKSRGWDPMAEGDEPGGENSFVHAVRHAVLSQSTSPEASGRKEKMLAWLEKTELENISRINSGASGPLNGSLTANASKAKSGPRL